MKVKVLNIVLFLAILLPLEVAYGQSTAFTDPAKKEISIKIFPNPVQDVFQLSDAKGVKSISINNIAGREVRRFTVVGNQPYSISDLRKGVYIVRIFDFKDEPIKVVRLNKA